VFFDGTTDEAISELGKFEEVLAQQTVRASAIEKPPEWIKQVEAHETEQMDFRKRINMLYAASLARDDGIDWVCSIDADEMIVPGGGFAGIAELLGSVGADVDQILMPNFRLLPTLSTEENIFSSQTVFIQRKDRLRNLWHVVNALLGTLHVSPKERSVFEHFL
jgi:hypothetical protein